MKRLISFLFTGFLFFTAAAQEIPKWKIGQLQEFIQNSERPTIINFWATFCKPCIEEMPYFQEGVKKYDSAGVQLLFVSLDLEEAYPKIKSFAAKRKITAPIVFLNETNADEFCPKIDASWSGAIPASLFINNKTGYRRFHEDQLPPQKLETEIKAMIAQ